MAGHAILSPSSASRWLACTPSARLEAQMPDQAGEAAREGTVAHALAELQLRRHFGFEIDKELEQKAYEAPYYSAEMEDFVAEYVEYVIGRAEEMKQYGAVSVFLETRVDLRAFIPDGFGTRDVVILSGDKAIMIDLKYGKGVPVSAHGNKQLMVYAAGTVLEMALVYDVQTIEMVIHQPRLDSISEYEMAVDQLLVWAETELKYRAMLAFRGEGDFVAGEHCKFCRVKNTCRAFSEHSLEAARRDFIEPTMLSDDEIAEILDKADAAISYLKGLQDYAFEQAVNHGKKWPGYKLVEGRSNRVITDQDAAVDRLIKAGIDRSVLYKPPTLVSLTELEKTVGKKAFSTILADLIDKPAGKPTLVPVSDKRQELNSALDDFRDEL